MITSSYFSRFVVHSANASRYHVKYFIECINIWSKGSTPEIYVLFVNSLLFVFVITSTSKHYSTPI